MLLAVKRPLVRNSFVSRPMVHTLWITGLSSVIWKPLPDTFRTFLCKGLLMWPKKCLSGNGLERHSMKDRKSPVFLGVNLLSP